MTYEVGEELWLGLFEQVEELDGAERGGHVHCRVVVLVVGFGDAGAVVEADLGGGEVAELDGAVEGHVVVAVEHLQQCVAFLVAALACIQSY